MSYSSLQRGALRLIRPAQVYKVAIVFLPALFHGQGSLQQHFPGLLLTAIAWVLASGSVYVFNDIWDLPLDRLLPNRSHRPLVEGALSLTQAWATLLVCLATLGALLAQMPLALSLAIGTYLVLNLAYTLKLKRVVGLRQASVALGFWLRFKSGAEPMFPIPITPWGSIFTLALAYYLNCLKGERLQDGKSPYPGWSGAKLSGSLVLASLCSLCIRRALMGHLAFPEFPPLLCLICLHRIASATSDGGGSREQAPLFFRDWVVLGCGLAFGALLADFH